MSLLWLLVGFVVGVALLPAPIYLLGPSLPMKGLFGNIHMMLMQLARGGSMLVYRGDGVEFAPLRHDDETGQTFAGVGDEWQAIQPDTTHRFAFGDLVIGYEPAQCLGDVVVDKSDLPQEPGQPIEDSRGGYRAFSPFSRHTDGLVVHAAQYIKRIGRQGTQLYNRTEEEALKTFGGDTHRSQLVFMLILLAATMIMFTITYLFLSL